MLYSARNYMSDITWQIKAHKNMAENRPWQKIAHGRKSPIT
jgi:hypothetical protein